MKKFLLTLFIFLGAVCGAMAGQTVIDLTTGYPNKNNISYGVLDASKFASTTDTGWLNDFALSCSANHAGSGIFYAQMRSTKSSYFLNKTDLGVIKSIEIEWYENSGKFAVYTNNKAYTEYAKTPAGTNVGTISSAANGKTTKLDISGDAHYFIMVNDGTSIAKFNKITVTYADGGSVTPTPDPDPVDFSLTVKNGNTEVVADDAVELTLGQSLTISAPGSTYTSLMCRWGDGADDYEYVEFDDPESAVWTPAVPMDVAEVYVFAQGPEGAYEDMTFYLSVAEPVKPQLPVGGVWQLVEDAATLAAGDYIIITDKDATRAMANKLHATSKEGQLTIDSEIIEAADDLSTITPTDNTLIINLEGQSDKWLFHTLNWDAETDKSQVYIGNTNTSNACFTVSKQPLETYEATIVINNSSHYTIKYNNAETTANVLPGYHSGSSWFRCYKETSTVDKHLKLYRWVNKPAAPKADEVVFDYKTAVDESGFTINGVDYAKANVAHLEFMAMPEGAAPEAYVVTFPDGKTHEVAVADGMANETYSFVEPTGRDEIFKVQAKVAGQLSDALDVVVTMSAFTGHELVAEFTDMELEGDVEGDHADYELRASVIVTPAADVTFHGRHTAMSSSHSSALFDELEAEGQGAMFNITVPGYVTIPVVDGKPVTDGVVYPEVTVDLAADYPVVWSAELMPASAAVTAARRAPAVEQLQSRIDRVTGTARLQFAGDRIITAIDDVTADTADAIYYNLQGMRVETPARGGLYIRVAGDRTAKVRY